MQRKILAPLFVSLFVVAQVVCLAQEEPSRENEHKALRALKEKATEALNKQDFDTLASCFTDDFIFIAVDQTVIKGKQELIDYYDRVFRKGMYPLKSLKVEPEATALTRFLDADTGVCYGNAQNTYVLKSGITVTMESRWSATVTKKDGKWKVAMVHTGVDFLDNPVLDSITSASKVPLAIMIVITACCLIVTVIVIFRKRRQAEKG